MIDSGYDSEANTSALEHRSAVPHIATERLKHNEEIPRYRVVGFPRTCRPSNERRASCEPRKAAM